MKVLALEPYYGGSHRAFLDGWTARSRHEWTTLGLPAHSWKWRMRHAPLTFAQQIDQRLESEGPWDLLFCSDMLSLTELRGLASKSIANLPAVVYFHENQLTYPVREANYRDLHFSFTNFTTAWAGSQVWFNSRFHQEDFLAACEQFLRRMPDHQPTALVEEVRLKSHVQAPGIEQFAPPPSTRPPGPLRIAWASRWEHDKNPEDFFAALGQLQREGVDVRLSVLGEAFRDVPPVFADAHQQFAANIDHWGFLESVQEYRQALAAADVFVSTANHEFFGIAAVEAMAAGCYPLLPNRLAYPELITDATGEIRSEFLYDGTLQGLTERLKQLALQVSQPDWQPGAALQYSARFQWEVRVPQLDQKLEEVFRGAS